MRQALLLLLLATLLVACESTPTAEGDLPGPRPTEITLAYPAQIWLDRTLDLGSYTPAQLDEIARCPAAIFQLRLILSEEGAPQVAALKQRNPDMAVLGVFQVLSYEERWDEPDFRERFPLSAAAFDLLQPHTAQTTEGAVPLMWLGAPMVNPSDGGTLDIALLDALGDLVQTHVAWHPGLVDGVMHDYMSRLPWIYPSPEIADIGDVDLDGDGIGAREDPDDEAVWVQWQVELARDWQQRFGVDFVQIANGALPHRNAELAGALAGIIYEAFPSMVWNYTPQEGLELALEHQLPGWLTPRRGRLWNVFWDRAGNTTPFCRLSSMLAGQLYALSDLQGYPGLDPDGLDPQLPLTPMQRIEVETGGVRFERVYPQGLAIIELSDLGYPTRVEFESF